MDKRISIDTHTHGETKYLLYKYYFANNLIFFLSIEFDDISLDGIIF